MSRSTANTPPAARLAARDVQHKKETHEARVGGSTQLRSSERIGVLAESSGRERLRQHVGSIVVGANIH